MSDALRLAAQAVLDRWDSPQWEWTKQGPTADLIADLRAALSAPPPVVPAGWQLVPVEPHPRLLNVLFGYWLDPVNNLKHRAIAAAEWRSMLAAAPQAPTQREGD